MKRIVHNRSWASRGGEGDIYIISLGSGVHTTDFKLQLYCGYIFYSSGPFGEVREDVIFADELLLTRVVESSITILVYPFVIPVLMELVVVEYRFKDKVIMQHIEQHINPRAPP